MEQAEFETALREHESCVFIDPAPHGSVLEILRKAAIAVGRADDVLVINPMDPAHSNTYNPILYGDPDEVASRIASAILVEDEGNKGADFYRMSILAVLVPLIAALQRARLPYNFADLSKFLVNADALAELEKKVHTDAPNSTEARNLSICLERFKVSGAIDIEKLKTAIGGLGGGFFTLGTGNFGEVMNAYDPEVKLHEAIRTNKIVYCALPVMGKTAMAKYMGKLFLGDLNVATSSEAAHPWPLIVWMKNLSLPGCRTPRQGLNDMGNYKEVAQ